MLCVDPVPPVVSAEAEGSDLRSTAFLLPALELLDRAGLKARLEPFAAPLRVMRIVDAGGAEGVVRATADFRAEETGAELFGWNLPNWLLRREMVARLAELPAAELRAGVRVERVTPRSAGAIVALSGGEQARAALVIAADGRDSPLRRSLGIGARRWGYGQKALVFTVAHERPHEGVSTEIHRSGGPFTLVPLPDRDGEPQSAVVWMERGSRAAALAALPDEAFGEAATARSCGLLGRLRPVGRRAVWPIVTQVATRLDGPRTALVAEAAHVVPPIGAQGLNMSLRDIATLLDLARGGAVSGGGHRRGAAARRLPPAAPRRHAAARRRDRRAEPGGDRRGAAAARAAGARAGGAARGRAAAPAGDASRAGHGRDECPRADKSQVIVKQ